MRRRRRCSATPARSSLANLSAIGFPSASAAGTLICARAPLPIHGAVRWGQTGFFGVRKDGSEFPVEVGLNPVVMSAGQFVIATVVDITERKAQLWSAWHVTTVAALFGFGFVITVGLKPLALGIPRKGFGVWRRTAGPGCRRSLCRIPERRLCSRVAACASDGRAGR